MTIYNEKFLHSKIIPWRIRNSIEKWVENNARTKHPWFYEFLHFGRFKNIVEPITHGPKHHFFGYYEKTPWNQSGNLILAHEADFNDRPPNESDTVKVGVVELGNSNNFKPLVSTSAWNWQQGALAQWHPANPENWFVYNDRENDKFIGIVCDINGEKIRTYSRPIYAIAPNGRQAFSLNFARLHNYRPGYGYAGVSDPSADNLYPEDDGIYSIDMESGESKLIISLHDLATKDATEEMLNTPHWVNHIQVSPKGNRFAFFHIWRVAETGWRVRFYTANLDGSGLNCLLDTDFISHYDWKDDQNILIWAKHPDTGKDRFLFCNDKKNSITVVGEGILTEDGHCSYSPDRQWVLNDTYPDSFDMRTLMLFKPDGDQRIDLARLYSPKKKWWGEIRCDLHPRWNRDGTQICIDSVHSGERQLYIANIKDFLK